MRWEWRRLRRAGRRWWRRSCSAGSTGPRRPPASRGRDWTHNRCATMSPMEVRDATADDWPAIWRFMRDIAAAGETFSWDRDIAEDDARAYWLRGAPARAFV